MHKITIPVQRNTGSYTASDSVIVSSQPNISRAVSSGKVMPVALKFYEMVCLSESEKTSWNISDELKANIESKGFTYFTPLVNGDNMRGYTMDVTPQMMNNTNAVELQKPTSILLESIFGYWNVYEMDFEKLEKQENITEDSLLDLYCYSDYTAIKVKIEENLTMDDSTSSTIIIETDEGTSGDIPVELYSYEITKGMIQEFELEVPVTETKQLKITSTQWNNASVDIIIKHIIN